MSIENISVVYRPITTLVFAEYNPRKYSKEQAGQLAESLRRYGFVDPVICNSATGRENVIIGGHFRVEVAKDLGITEVPVVYVNIADLDLEKELNLRLNKNTGEFDLELLKEYFDEAALTDVGFSSEEIDDIFGLGEDTPETFDVAKELEKLEIDGVEAKTGDIYDLDGSRLMVGDSTKEEDILALMGGEKADMCFTDPPYILDYLHGKKKHGQATEGFGLRRDRQYIGTDVLPPDFSDLWMANVAAVANKDFSIIVYENPKNLRTIWNALEKHWKYRNTIIWHVPNRVQGFAAKYKFFNKYDFAIVGTGGDTELNLEPEEPLLQEEYETALFATSGKPHWEGYDKGKKICPTDFIEHVASDEKSSGQSIIFGTKPVEILIPYIKVLTKRGDLVIEPFGGSGSTLIAATKMKRRCFTMEKCDIYAEVIKKRWENLTGKRAVKIHAGS